MSEVESASSRVIYGGTEREREREREREVMGCEMSSLFLALYKKSLPISTTQLGKTRHDVGVFFQQR